MSNKIVTEILFLPILFLLSSGSGCIKQPLPIYYYTLWNSDQQVVATGESPVSILVGPIHITSVLDQGQLVTQNSGYSVNIEEQHRWAGNLQEMLTTAIITNLRLDLGSEKIYTFPDAKNSDGFQVVIDLLHFEKDSDGYAYMMARWKILAPNKNNTLYEKTSRLRKLPESDEFEALSKALSHCISDLSTEIADRIRTLTSDQRNLL